MHRCGVVALLGRPNAGKSTLLNALIGEKLAITGPRAQTTRGRTRGLWNRPGVQIVFCDTPGINRGQTRFNRAMTETALACGRDADVRLLLLDVRAHWDEPEQAVANLEGPTLLVRTKIDTNPPLPVPCPERFAATSPISARDGTGLDALCEAILPLIPESPPLYPEDQLTDVSERFLAAEQVREVAFEIYRDEIPYALAVEIEEWRETPEPLRIRAHVLVEHESQKAIVVGAGGAMLKKLGRESRVRISSGLGKAVHLELWVKTDRSWRKRPKRSRELGYL